MADYDLKVTDSKYPENSFSESRDKIFYHLYYLAEIYGVEFVSENFDKLTSGKEVSFEGWSTDHVVVIEVQKT